MQFVKKSLKTFSLWTILVSISSADQLRAPPGECTEPGDVICSSDCSAIQLCLPTNETITLNTCASGKTCWQDTMTCEESLNSCREPFVCTGVGAYPDPFDCTKYHLCVGEHRERRCAPGWAYTSRASTCTQRVDSNPRFCVENPVPKCTSIGQAGALCEDTRIYYICFGEGTSLYPVLYQCANSWEFDEEKFECVNWEERSSNIVNGCTP